VIAAEGVSHSFGGADVLRSVALEAHPGEVVGLIGPNGSGKTTLLRALYRALTPAEGDITVDEAPIGSFRPRQLARSLAVVAQEPPGELPLSVADVVMLGRSPHLGPLQRVTRGDVDIAADALRRVGAEHLADRELDELSGGERQRVLIARALAQQATHLLMDEPTNHLDIHFQHEVLALVRELAVTTIVVLHDLNLAARYCDRVVLLSRGQVVAAGRVEEVLDPVVLEPVYGIGVEQVHAGDGRLQLLFRSPRHTTRQTHDHDGGAEAADHEVRVSPRT
jgi:iron complex transport system ATP-binding protein